MMMLIVSLVVVFCGLWGFCSSREHLLSTLLNLEFMVLGVFFSLVIFFNTGSLFYSLFYLIMTACEGALGLSMLVLMGRTHGGDYLKSFSFLFD